MRRVASRVMVVVGLYQGAVPLVVRAAFGGEQRFAPALWLPAPWWWIACLGVVVVAGGLAVWLEPEDHEAGDAGKDRDTRATPVAAYDALSGVVFLLGLYNGVVPFVARLVFDGTPLFAFTLRLPAPWWWLASLGVIGVAVALLAIIDEAKKRRLPSATP